MRHLGAERIGHGIAAIEDPELVRHLAEHDVALELCPTSNVATGAVASLDAHPMRALREAGVPVTVNSDDPSMFGTTLTNEYVVAAGLLSLDEAGVVTLAQAAVNASFATPQVKRRLLLEIAAALPAEQVAGSP